jgi:hypothetical protein
MRIKSFRAMGHLVRVKYNKSIKGGLLGDCDPNKHLLKVSTNHKKEVLPESTIEHSRLHEQVHYWLKLMGREELYKDEGFVDGLAGLIHQYEESKE